MSLDREEELEEEEESLEEEEYDLRRFLRLDDIIALDTSG